MTACVEMRRKLVMIRMNRTSRISRKLVMLRMNRTSYISRKLVMNHYRIHHRTGKHRKHRKAMLSLRSLTLALTHAWLGRTWSDRARIGLGSGSIGSIGSIGCDGVDWV